ncbi:uncharacterized protein LOC128883893 [Hylaeus volcanicus]|uniref:uncharacterized protein LOC128883893 n=1 Tax=Hylaeus volcanicus TaxID=313075 RepID=UPI0023B7F480|nr:uncharacterized protein LOC128883893 [Hylaeus volcanicus]
MSSYTFANVCGAPFEGGQITFDKTGNCLLVPSSNRVTVYDLRQNRVQTLPFEARQNIQYILCSPIMNILITIDVIGRAVVVNSTNSVILSRFSFSHPISAAKFSSCGKYLATASQKALKFWDVPTMENRWFCSLRRKIQHHADTIVSVCWSCDSEYVCTGSKDLTVRIFSCNPKEGFKVLTFVEHRSPLCGAFFSQNMKYVIGVATDGTMISWNWMTDVEKHEQDEILGSSTENRAFSLQRVPTHSLSKDDEKNVHRELRKKRLAENFETKQSDNSENKNKLPDYSKGSWKMECKVFCNQSGGALISQVAYNSLINLLATGFSNGLICLYSTPDFAALYTLSIGNSPLDALEITSDGEWLAIGNSYAGQIVVWEWKSETYILKQQAHGTGIRCVACCPTLDRVTQNRIGGDNKSSSSLGLIQRSVAVATGGEDGKLKLWDSVSGFNYMTFTDHVAPINDIVFTPQGNAVISASNDGTVRCYDLARYRCFRTFSSTQNGIQFFCLAIDGSGELIVAGTRGTEYSLYVWSLQTGKQIEYLSGHEACISCVMFDPHPNRSGTLISSSWDKTLRVWTLFGRIGKGGEAEPLCHSSSVLCLAFDPRGNNQIAVSTLCGNIWFWNVQDATVLGSIDGLRDIKSGRNVSDKYAANNSRSTSEKKTNATSVGSGVLQNQHFTTIVYSSNGSWLLAASQTSPRVCIYASDTRELLHSVSLSKNISFDSILIELNSKLMTESGFSIQEIDASDSDEDEVTRQQKRIQQHKALPGIEVGDLKPLHERKKFKIWKLAFSQDGQQWCAATSHGLFTFSLDSKNCMALSNRSMGSYQASGISSLDTFRPNLITKKVSPESILNVLKKNPAQAMILALGLNDFMWLSRVYVSIPYKYIGVVVESIPPLFLPALLNFLRICLMEPSQNQINEDINLSTPDLSTSLGGSPHLQFHLHWLTCILSCHLSVLQQIDCKHEIYKTNHDSIQDKKEVSLFQLDSSRTDLYSICLLLLRNVRKIHSNLGSLFKLNLHTLDALLLFKNVSKARECVEVNNVDLTMS